MTIAVPDIHARTALDLGVLSPVLGAPGPVVSVYLDTTARSENAAELTWLRWRAVRDHLETVGAPRAALDAVEVLVSSAHARGEVLVAFADGGGVLHSEALPDPLVVDSVGVDPAGTGVARYAPLAWVTPLVAAWQGQLPYLAVATDRLGAELVAVLPHRPDEEVLVEGHDLHVTRSAPGGWSQRRYQQRAENRWEANAGMVVDALTSMVDRHAPRLVVVTGDVRAVQMLRDQAPERVSRLLVEVQGEYGAADHVLGPAAALAAEQAAQDGTQLLALFAERHGRRDRAALGATDVLATVAQSLADVVLLDAEALADRTAWFGPEPSQVGVDPDALLAYGVTDIREGQLTDVVIRAAVGGGTSVRIYHNRPEELRGGAIGALLRGRGGGP